jgi:beta-galactosidase GanA
MPDITPTFPFGSQYLRGMTPPRGDWAVDMRNMRAAGFNTIRAWLVWGVLEPRPGEVDFDYLDTFLDLAADNDLKVGFLFHLHGCPEWMTRRYPQWRYEDIRGLPFEPSQRANTPSGGWPGLCPDNPEVQELEARFIQAVCTHAADHPAVAFWEPINEPHMWVDMAQNPPGTFCYCAATRQVFREWLQARYGALEALEEAWGRRFSCWEDVRPPTWIFGFSDWVDWRTFTTENIAGLVDRRAKVIRAHAPQPVIGHAWGGGCVTCQQLGAMAFDDWKNAAPLDMWGYSAFPVQAHQTLMVGLGTDATRNAAQGKEFWQSELGAGDYGSGFGRSGRIRPEVETMFCWESIRHGAKGLLFWQYRKEAHGSEIGAFGLTDYAGNRTELLDAVGTVGRVLSDHAPLFRRAEVQPASVALVFSFRTFMADWAQHRNCNLSVDALSGYYRVFWDANIPVDIVHEEFADAATLAKYRLVILPDPAALCESVRAPLAEYVRAGGTLLSDPYLCGFNADLSLPREVPGGGFAEVFGAREVDIASARNRTVELHVGEAIFPVSGSHFQAWWEPQEGTDVLGHYADGKVALTARTDGSGRAVLSGVNLGLACSPRQGVGDDFTREATGARIAETRELVLAIAQEAGVQLQITTPPDVRASVLHAGPETVLIALNTADSPRVGRIDLTGIAATRAEDLIAEADLGFWPQELSFGPYETKVFLLRG